MVTMNQLSQNHLIEKSKWLPNVTWEFKFIFSYAFYKNLFLTKLSGLVKF